MTDEQIIDAVTKDLKGLTMKAQEIVKEEVKRRNLNLDSFYVEVEYNKKLNVLNSSRSFSSTTQLEPYLKLIDISKIKLYMVPTL
jgi:hypothetical protein